MYLAGGDGKLSVWDVNNFTLFNTIQLTDRSIRTISFHPNFNELALGCSDNNIYIIDPYKFKLLHTLKRHKNSVFVVKYSPNGKILLSGSRDAHLNIWQVEKHYQFVASVPAHYYTINDITYNEDGSLFATGSRDKTIKIWDALDFSFLKKIEAGRESAHTGSINKLLWIKDYLISASDDRSVIVWKVKINKLK